VINKTEIKEEPYRIPVFQHPNSPYVPWTRPIRRQILHPLTSALQLTVTSTTYSRSYSRSGASAPEPGEAAMQRLPSSRSWRNIRRTVIQNVQQVTKRLVKSFKSEKPAPALRVQHIPNSVGRVQKRMPSSPRQHIASRRLRSPASLDSVTSTDTNSLAIWLAARKREALERENHPSSLMTLEEYECMGSWIDVTKAANGAWSCGVPQCKLHKANAVVISCEERAAGLSHEHSRRAVAAMTPISSFSSSYMASPSRSMPQLPSLTSRWFESVDDLTPIGTNTGRSLKATRHQSMPGGWTFPL
jgi:hypothetical protein